MKAVSGLIATGFGHDGFAGAHSEVEYNFRVADGAGHFEDQTGVVFVGVKTEVGDDSTEAGFTDLGVGHFDVVAPVGESSWTDFDQPDVVFRACIRWYDRQSV